MKYTKHHRLKGFTLTEVLVTLALTSIAITFAYGSFNYVNKLFIDYRQQNRFLTECINLKNRLSYEMLYADSFMESGENEFLSKRGNDSVSIEIKENCILFKKNEACDTFHLEVREIAKSFEYMKNPVYVNKLVAGLNFEVEFSKQRFNFYFYKQHCGDVKLLFEQMN